ncbi:acyl-CoA dehydrogenase family protein [Nocardioides zeae]|uniref:Acyl-CoA dehydrogenase family protein n=1 Tax=Nocardioides imazamoxiresistens TaxID=3231893 RepID=A0ABU3PSG7_9ACTN|nr:acyl-CoA dehydrogenase family protein [Nocardioides zeae]MDT9592171.1 acyl-CoA dehydrogenase family protein [Nocardioides zeae]
MTQSPTTEATEATEFAFSDDLVELRQMVREFCAEVVPEEVVRAAMESDLGHDPALWRRLGSELGVLGLAVPEELGGDGIGLVAQAVVLEEMGAALVPGPVVGTLALAVPALSVLPHSALAAELLGSALTGTTVLALAAPLGSGTFESDALGASTTRDGEAWTVHGVVDHVPDGAAADVLLVAARTADGAVLLAVDGDAPGLSRTAHSTMDLTRRQARLDLVDVPARLVADVDAAAGACEQAARVGAVLLAAEQVGGAQRMLDRTVEHASTRLQFGQAIGAFQAVKHKCADMFMAVEQARSAAYHGAWALQDGTDDPRLAASLARAVASETYFRVAATAIQLHGGLGFTWEYPAHLYLKRAVSDAAVLGAADDHVEQVARQVIDGA